MSIRQVPGYEQGLRPPSRIAFTLVAVLIPLLLASFAFWLAHEYGLQDQARTAVRASYDRRITELELTALLKDAETGQRGYLITGVDAYLDPYTAATGDANRELKSVRELTSDNPNQQARLDKLEPLITDKSAALKETIDLRKTDPKFQGPRLGAYLAAKDVCSILKALATNP